MRVMNLENVIVSALKMFVIALSAAAVSEFFALCPPYLPNEESGLNFLFAPTTGYGGAKVAVEKRIKYCRRKKRYGSRLRSGSVLFWS